MDFLALVLLFNSFLSFSLICQAGSVGVKIAFSVLFVLEKAFTYTAKEIFLLKNSEKDWRRRLSLR